MDLPILANYLQFTDLNWRYKSMPGTKYCMGMNNRQCNYPRGKVMGGSSVLNYMIHNRGNYRDYDNWAQMGNQGWSYEDVLPYFKKLEHFKIREMYDEKYHGLDGYVSVSYAPYKTKITDYVIQAGMEMGFKQNDHNARNQPGISRIQAALNDGIRASASRSYLHPIRDRTNLHVTKMTTVTKVLIDPKTKQAYGVSFVKNGDPHIVTVRKEVILSAGAINSPQLLMLSGVGPKKHLTQLGIPVIQNLKVGYNLMDHIAMGGLTFRINKPYSITTNKMLQAESLSEYFNHHRGPLTIPGGCEVILFADLKNLNDTDGYPDMELLVEAGSIASDPVLYKDFGITDEIYNEVFKPIEYKETFMILPMLLRPKSKGRIMLGSADYRTKPLIFPNYFSNTEDLKTMVEGAKLAVALSQQKPMQEIGTKIHSIPIPQCKHLLFQSDEYWACMAKYMTLTIYHQSGTCKMGPATDKKAVVDPRLRVYGIKGLRVIDASIMPEIPAAHTNAPTYMIGEKGADMIKEDWGFV